MSTQTISAVNNTAVYVLTSDGQVWLDQTPFSQVPPPSRGHVYTDALGCWAVSATTVYVLGSDGNLYFATAPFVTPPLQVDSNAVACAPVDANTVYVLGSDGNLWKETGPFQTTDPVTGAVTDYPRDQGPRHCVQVDSNVIACAAVNDTTIFVIDREGNLWLEVATDSAPWGTTIPPARTHIDSRVIGCSAVDQNTVYVLGSDGNLWLESAPFGERLPPLRTLVDSNVAGCSAVDHSQVYVVGYDGKLWLEKGPFGTIPPSRTLVDTGISMPRFEHRTHDLVVDIRDFGARLDGRSISDGAMTATLEGKLANILTSATYAFQPSDVGKLIVVQFAGPSDNGCGVPLTSKITDLFEGAGAVLQDPALTTTMPTSLLEMAPGPSPVTITAVIPGNPTTIQIDPPPMPYRNGDQVWIDNTEVSQNDAAGKEVLLLDKQTFEISSVNTISTQFTVPVDTTEATLPAGAPGIAANNSIHIKQVIPGDPTVIETVEPNWYSGMDSITIYGTGLPMLDGHIFPVSQVGGGLPKNQFAIPVGTTSGSTTGTATNNTVHVHHATTAAPNEFLTGMTVKIPSIDLVVDQKGNPVDGSQVQYVSDTEFTLSGQIAVAVDGSQVPDASVSGSGSRVDWGTDDHQAWTDAIAAASTGGAHSATVHAGPGTSLVSNTITVDASASAAGITISGAGPGGQDALTGTRIILGAPPTPPPDLTPQAFTDWLPSLVDWKTTNAKMENLWLDGANIAPLKDNKPVPLHTLLLEYFTTNCLFERLLISGATVDKGASKPGRIPDGTGGAEIHIYGPDTYVDEIDNVRFHRVSIFHDPDHIGTPAKSQFNVLLDGDAQAGQINFDLIQTFDGASGFKLVSGGVNIDHAQIFSNSYGMIVYEAIQWSRWNDIYTERNSGVPFLKELNSSAANGAQPIVVSGCRIADNCQIQTGCKQPLLLIGNSLGGDVVIDPAAPPPPITALAVTDLLNGSATVTFPLYTVFPAGLGLEFSTQKQVIYTLAGPVNDSTGYSGTLTTPYTGPSAAAATVAVVLLATATVTNNSTAATFSTPQTLLAGTVLRFSSENNYAVPHVIAYPVTESVSATLTAPYQGPDEDATAVTAQQPIGVYHVADYGNAFGAGHGFIGDLTHLEQLGSQLPLTTEAVRGYDSSVQVTARATNLTTQQALTVGGSEAQHTTIRDTASYTCDTDLDPAGNIVPDRVVVSQSSTGMQITLPAPSMGRVITVVDDTGLASTDAPIELLPHGGEAINNTTSARMTASWGSLTVRSPDGVTWIAEQPPVAVGNGFAQLTLTGDASDDTGAGTLQVVGTLSDDATLTIPARTGGPIVIDASQLLLRANTFHVNTPDGAKPIDVGKATRQRAILYCDGTNLFIAAHG
jgi:hypothetical protein